MIMKNIWIILGCSVLLLLSACSNEQSPYKNASTESRQSTATAVPEMGFTALQKNNAKSKEAVAESAAKDRVSDVAANLANRKMIKTADYRMQVKSVDESTERIQDIVTTFGGVVSNMNLSANTHSVNNEINLLVPNQNFEDLLKALSGEAVFVNHRKINSTDVTEEFVDLESRLKTKKEVRDRYIQILRNKASTITEVFEAEEKIRVLQEEIEAKEGRLKYLSEKVALSTIKLSIYESVKEAAEPVIYQASLQNKFKKNFLSGGNVIVDLFLFLASIWPFLILAALAYWKISRKFIAYRRKRNEPVV